ncbi:MAG: AAA family ATPase [Deltaproteobacteria bacterium]|nr:AAA family ATPase [Deltaproteobacteria bacterium]
MFDELAAQIMHLLGKKLVVVVAISGFGGSGKSTLADRLRDHFQVADTQVVRIDNLYSQNPLGPGIFDQSDWPLITRILEDVRAGKRLQYRGTDSNGQHVHIDEALPQVLIFEGVRLLQPDLMSNFDVSVWIDCPQDLAMKRAKARDREQGNSEETVLQWDTHWGPIDRKYFDMYRPDRLAAVVYR